LLACLFTSLDSKRVFVSLGRSLFSSRLRWLSSPKFEIDRRALMWHLELADASLAQNRLPSHIVLQPGSTVTIGREGDDVICLDPVDADTPVWALNLISRRHASIALGAAGPPVLTDFSMNGCEVDGKGADTNVAVPLTDGSTILFGARGQPGCTKKRKKWVERRFKYVVRLGAPPGALNLPIWQWLETIHTGFGNLYGPALKDKGYDQLSFIDGDDELFDNMMKTLRDSTVGKKLPHYKKIEKAARKALSLPPGPSQPYAAPEAAPNQPPARSTATASQPVASAAVPEPASAPPDALAAVTPTASASESNSFDLANAMPAASHMAADSLGDRKVQDVDHDDYVIRCGRHIHLQDLRPTHPAPAPAHAPAPAPAPAVARPAVDKTIDKVQDVEEAAGEQTEVEEGDGEEEVSDVEMDAAPAELSPTIDDAALPAETFTSPPAHPIPELPAEGDVESLSNRDLKELIARAGLDTFGCIDKADLIQRYREAIAKSSSAGSAPPSAGEDAQAPPPACAPAAASNPAPATSSSELAAVDEILSSRADPYKSLGVAVNATDAEIKKAFRNRCLHVHPDKCQHPSAKVAFQVISDAFAVLSDASKRAALDQARSAQQHLVALTQEARCCKVKVLKAVLSSNRQLTSGNKSELADRLARFVYARAQNNVVAAVAMLRGECDQQAQRHVQAQQQAQQRAQQEHACQEREALRQRAAEVAARQELERHFEGNPQQEPDKAASDKAAADSAAAENVAADKTAAEKEGRGIERYANGDVYEGEYKAGKKEGRGIYRYASSDVYEGEFKAGKKEGRGIFRSASDNVYEGEFKAGKKEGRGIFRSADGAVYEGEFKADKKEGRGIFRSADGAVYEGEFKAGKKEGRGIYRWANGDVYEGEWKAGEREGRGISRYANGDVYEGEYKSGEREGRGIYRLANGNVYEGEYKAGKKEGRGIFRYASGNDYEGDIFDGEWKAGEREGQGTYLYASGDIEVGFYKADKRVGDGVRWTVEGRSAWQLQDGEAVKTISLEEADRRVERLGLPMPVRREGKWAARANTGRPMDWQGREIACADEEDRAIACRMLASNDARPVVQKMLSRPEGAQQVLFRPLAELCITAAVCNIIEARDISKSGHPDMVMLTQLKEGAVVGTAMPSPPDKAASDKAAADRAAAEEKVAADKAAADKEGRRIERYANGDVYEGEFKAGNMEGRGIFRYASGGVYEGEYKAGEKEGRGIYRYANGDVYEGEFKAGNMEGRGISRFADGAVHEGEFKAGKKEGRGIFRSADGAVHEGEYKAGKREGRGISRYADGAVYEGEYKAGKKEGRGIFRSADGAVHECEYKAGKKEGRGIERHADGAVYEGEYKAGKKEGRGIYRWANGDVYEGEWKADKREGRGISRYANGDVYEGEYKSNEREGRGIYRLASGHVYEGEFKAGEKEGRGIFRYANGDVYEGEFKAGKREGQGTYLYADGNIEVGFDKAGIDVGEGVRWTADGRSAWQLQDGKVVKTISLEEADRRVERLGLPMPVCREGKWAAGQRGLTAG
jgi:hypothetical protein